MKWLIGIAAGAAAVYFLKTEKGKAFLDNLSKEAGSVGENLYGMAESLFKQGTSFAEKAADKAKSAM